MAASGSESDFQPVSEKNLDGYGAPPIAWSRVCERLERLTEGPHTCWLATARPEGRPHVMPVGALWVDRAFYFTAGPAMRKAKNLAHDSHCVISVATQDLDLVIEGEAAKVSDAAQLQRIAELYASQGWEATVRDGAFYAEYSAPSAGAPPWEQYEVTPATLFAMGTAEPLGATRWRF